jgi:putative redox protein
MQLLGMALLGCMSTDVVDILRKGRHPLTKFHASLVAERAPDPPRRFLKVQLQFAIHGDVPAAAVERAIALSREKYCSVWHSLREDIELTAAFDILTEP